MSSTIPLYIIPAVIVTATLARDLTLIVGMGVAIIVLLLLAPNAAREAGQTLQDKARRW